MQISQGMLFAFVLIGIGAILSILAMDLGQDDIWSQLNTNPALESHHGQIRDHVRSITLQGLCFSWLGSWFPSLCRGSRVIAEARESSCGGLPHILGEQRYFYEMAAAHGVRAHEFTLTLDAIKVIGSSHTDADHPLFDLLASLSDEREALRNALLQLNAHIELSLFGIMQVDKALLGALYLGRPVFAQQSLYKIPLGETLVFSLATTFASFDHIARAGHAASESTATVLGRVLDIQNAMERVALNRTFAGVATSARLNCTSVTPSLTSLQDQLADLVSIAVDVGEAIPHTLQGVLVNATCPLDVAVLSLRIEYSHLKNLALWARSRLHPEAA